MTLDSIMNDHDELRDNIAVTNLEYPTKKVDSLYAVVLVQSFLFCFNTYKALGIILRERYYEQASVLVRILWEATLNLAWVDEYPAQRAKLFCQFTVVEKRKFVLFKVSEAKRLRDTSALAAAEQNLRNFDAKYADVLDDYRFQDKKGKKKIRSRLSSPSIEEQARQLGGAWAKEYREVYPLLSLYAHATPGAILFPNSPDRLLSPERCVEEDIERTQMVALWSMALIERAHRFLQPLCGVNDSDYFESLNARINFRQSLA